MWQGNAELYTHKIWSLHKLMVYEVWNLYKVMRWSLSGQEALAWLVMLEDWWGTLPYLYRELPEVVECCTTNCRISTPQSTTICPITGLGDRFAFAPFTPKRNPQPGCPLDSTSSPVPWLAGTCFERLPGYLSGSASDLTHFPLSPQEQ